jgi:hypothetical protein
LGGRSRGMSAAVQTAATVAAAVGGRNVLSFAGFIDYGYFKNQGAKALRLDSDKVKVNPEEVVKWVRQFGSPMRNVFDDFHFPQFLRLYWYDGQWEEFVNPSDRRAQQPVFDKIAKTPGIQLRLGHLARRPGEEGLIRKALRDSATALGVDPDKLLVEFGNRYDIKGRPAQKGVDVLLALDLVRWHKTECMIRPFLLQVTVISQKPFVQLRTKDDE